MRKIIFFLILLVCLSGLYYFLLERESKALPQEQPNETVGGELQQGFISIDFDDGWQSQYDNAFPILKDTGLEATFYIITDTLVSEKNYRNYMSAEEVSELFRAGQEIGSHTVHHPFLTQIPPEEAKKEIVDSKSSLENLLETEITVFSYPGGDANEEVMVMVKIAGYKSGRTTLTKQVVNNKNTNPYLLQSTSIGQSMTFDDVKEIINNALETNTWQVLVFHQVDESGREYSVRPDLLRQVLEYIKTNNLPVVTTSEGLGRIK